MKPTLLLVDDNESLLRLLKSIFQKNYTVFTAEDGVDAIHFLSRGIRPEVIVCDLEMKNINGYEIVTHLSTSKLYQDIPVILLSESKKPLDIQLSANVALVLYKPFDPIFLSNAVGKVLSEGKRTVQPAGGMTEPIGTPVFTLTSKF